LNAERDEAVRRDEAARDEETVPRDERRGWTARVVVGVFLVLAGVAWILDELTGIGVPWRALVPALLIVVGIALVMGSSTGRHGGLIALGIVLAVLAAIGTVLPATPIAGVGERSAAPAHFDAVQDAYDLGIGRLEVDLSAVDFPDGETVVEINVGMGELIVIVPANVAVRAEGRAGMGEVVLLETTGSGIGVDEEFVDEGFGAEPSRLVIEARVGMGKAEVRR
jgi:hypothetical protein